ncbi:MAG: hypothetical protein GY781_06535 [Gammaproteobacteria bacterium]|nr:hypothetical protein [Gammaproteobacteria bacterium]
MKFISYVLIFVMSTGCTSLRSVGMSSEQLQNPNYLQNTVKKGDDIEVIMKDGTRYNFRITALTDQLIIGKNISIPIHDISTLAIEKISFGKTAALVGAVILLIGLMNTEITIFNSP